MSQNHIFEFKRWNAYERMVEMVYLNEKLVCNVKEIDQCNAIQRQSLCTRIPPWITIWPLATFLSSIFVLHVSCTSIYVQWSICTQKNSKRHTKQESEREREKCTRNPFDCFFFHKVVKRRVMTRESRIPRIVVIILQRSILLGWLISIRAWCVAERASKPYARRLLYSPPCI